MQAAHARRGGAKKTFPHIMATAEGAEGAETEKTPAERLFEAGGDGDVASTRCCRTRPRSSCTKSTSTKMSKD